MNPEIFRTALSMSETTGFAFITTADSAGLPHLSITNRLVRDHGDRIYSSAWNCPITITNLSENPHCTLVIWDQEQDTGYQLLCTMVQMEQTGFLDGYDARLDVHSDIPQVQWKIVFRVIRITGFRHAPHSDREE